MLAGELSIRQSVRPDLGTAGEGVARDGLESVSREVEFDEVGEVPEGVSVELGDAALRQADGLQVDEAPGGEHVAGEHRHLVTRHLQHLHHTHHHYHHHHRHRHHHYHYH